jgi:hypothetical protein
MSAHFQLDFHADPFRVSYMLNGAWTVLADINIGSRHLKPQMEEVAARAYSFHKPPFMCSIVLPGSHIIYKSIRWVEQQAPTIIDIKPKFSMLEGVDCEQLLVDSARTDDMVKYAVTERLTLLEAKHFAKGYNFVPFRYEGRPLKSEFPRVPVFPLCAKGNARWVLTAVADFLDRVRH